MTATRCPGNPLITFRSSPTLGTNINGPSVMRVPPWVQAPLGRYYLYFAHHGGTFIRLAYADRLEGPWRIHEPGVLSLDHVAGFAGHIASPDVHVDVDRQQIRLYFHCGRALDLAWQGGQATGVALSSDGLHFKISATVLGGFYFRVFRWQSQYYAIAKKGNSGWGELLRSRDGLTPFESRGDFIRRMRHCAVLVQGQRLLVFHSRVGDEPERILLATVDLAGDWTTWRDTVPVEVLRPELDYEGVQYPLRPSVAGCATEVQELRDPCVFEEDGRIHLFYSVAGEMGIALARIEGLCAPARPCSP